MNDISLTVVNVILLIAAIGAFVITAIKVAAPPRTYGDWAAFLVTLAVVMLVLLRFF